MLICDDMTWRRVRLTRSAWHGVISSVQPGCCWIISREKEGCSRTLSRQWDTGLVMRWGKQSPGINNISLSRVLVSEIRMKLLSSSVLLLVSSSQLSLSTEDQTYRKTAGDNFVNDVYYFGHPTNVKNHRELFNADNDMFMRDGR